MGSSQVPQARIEQIPDPVAEQVEAEHRDHDRRAGKHRGPRGHLHEGAALGQHAAPGRRRRLGAHPEEAQRGFGEDGRRDAEARLHQHRRHRIRQDVAKEPGRSPRPSAWAASTNSRCLMVSTAARTVRANTGR